MKKKTIFYFGISFFIIALDQITKFAVRYFMPNQSIPIFGKYFSLTHVQNPGAAFSIGFDAHGVNRVFFSVLTFFMIFVILIMMKKSKAGIEKFAYSLILGGAIGNLIDRLAFGSVTDFFDCYFFNIFGMERWPIFNIADSSIVVAIVILLIFIFFIDGKS